MERNHITRSERQRFVFFKIGLAISIGLTIMAFSWTIPYHSTDGRNENEDLQEDESIPVVRTVHRNKQLPPPVVKPMEEVIPENIELEFTEELIEETIEEEQTIERDPDDFRNDFTDTPEPTIPVKPDIPVEEPKVPEIFVIVEEMPVFGDCQDATLDKAERKRCSDAAILSYFAKNMRYPQIAKENHIEGTVVLQFIIDPVGNVTDVKVVREVAGGCSQEALRVARSMPQWRPGKQRNRPVKVQMNLPIRFKLQ